ncbi:MFS transporter, partial [Clostridium perfringens]|uniref:MFS transporter n=1 Tax=Clostridium perfringens TaxID=1502 RepID=UPI002ACC196E
SVAAAGQLITVYSLAYAIGTPILIALTAKMDRRKLMLSALGLFFVGNLITVTTTGYGMLLGARIILAISTGVFMVVALTVAANLGAYETGQPKRKQPAVYPPSAHSCSVQKNRRNIGVQQRLTQYPEKTD